MKKEYRNKKGELHRERGPAYISSDGSKEWYINGKRHREDGPACIGGTKEWYVKGRRHREDGPAIEWTDGSKSWYLNGKLFYSEQEWERELLKLFYERLKEYPESVELKGKIKNLETKLVSRKYGL